MADTATDLVTYTVRNISEGTVDDIRVLAAKHHVSQAQVLEEALWNFQCELGKSIPLPDYWRKPREF